MQHYSIRTYKCHSKLIEDSSQLVLTETGLGYSLFFFHVTCLSIIVLGKGSYFVVTTDADRLSSGRVIESDNLKVTSFLSHSCLLTTRNLPRGINSPVNFPYEQQKHQNTIWFRNKCWGKTSESFCLLIWIKIHYIEKSNLLVLISLEPSVHTDSRNHMKRDSDDLQWNGAFAANPSESHFSGQARGFYRNPGNKLSFSLYMTVPYPL